MTITESLKEALQGASLPDAAKSTGLEYQVLAGFIKGQQSLRLDQADRLAEHFGLTCTKQWRLLHWDTSHPKTDSQKLISEYVGLVERLTQAPPNVESWLARFRSFHLPDLWELGYREPEPSQTVYRGLSGLSVGQRQHGLSWSLSLYVACWFAARGNHPEPVVHASFVEDKDVFCMIPGEEREVVCDPPEFHRLEMSPQEIQRLADKYTVEPPEKPCE